MRHRGVSVTEVSKEELDLRAKTERHQGVLAQLDASEVNTVSVTDLLYRAESAGEDPLIVLLDGIQDPMNFGAILRSAFALGAHGVIIPKNRTARISPVVVRASAGAALHVAVAEVVNLKFAVEELKSNDIWVVATAAEGDPVDAVDVSGPLGVIIGGEAKGVRPHLAAICDHRVSIPQIPDFDSLNASVAAGILLYEAQRQRRGRT
ncbi:MAG: 23S rRNA (guanosine(2251)-2'-O)-methyltransferase RlmB [Myxococcales bacterium]|nr:23S rRNA (guanosine(2251)-2'-O)-methyltransferase RlmB [Myxococcales bacterium]